MISQILLNRNDCESEIQLSNRSDSMPFPDEFQQYPIWLVRRIQSNVGLNFIRYVKNLMESSDNVIVG
jgi:hypothetical protein